LYALLFAFQGICSERAGNVYTLYEHLYFVTKSILNNTLICISLHLITGHSKSQLLIKAKVDHYTQRDSVWGSRGIAVVICNRSTIWSASHSQKLLPEERVPSTHPI